MRLLYFGAQRLPGPAGGAVCLQVVWAGTRGGNEPNFPELFQVSLGEYGFSRAACLSVCHPSEGCGSLTGEFQTFLKDADIKRK